MKTLQNNITRAQQTAMINAYLLNSIDGENYGVTLSTDKDKVNFVVSTFTSEFLHHNNRNGNRQQLFADYLSGLPSCINIEFRNYAILELAEAWGSDVSTEKKRDFICSNWFNYISCKFFQLHAKMNK